MPSRDELIDMYYNLYKEGKGNFSEYDGSVNHYYLSSSEFETSPKYVYAKRFSKADWGIEENVLMTNGGYVRPARAF